MTSTQARLGGVVVHEDVLIRCVIVVDPARRLSVSREVLIGDGKIIAPAAGERVEAEQVVRYHRLPGCSGADRQSRTCLLGRQRHGRFAGGHLLPMGLTAAVEQGSAGIETGQVMVKVLGFEDLNPERNSRRLLTSESLLRRRIGDHLSCHRQSAPNASENIGGRKSSPK